MQVELPAFPVEGGCHCGAVRYRLNGRPRGVYRCHCKDCQRFSGAAWSMSMFVRRSDVELLSGEPSRYFKTADSGRTLEMVGCARCGTKLWNEPHSSPDFYVLKPGTLDQSGWAVPAGNIWTDSALPWVELEADVPNYPGQPPSRDELFAAWDARVVARA